MVGTERGGTEYLCPHKIPVLDPNPQCGGIRRRGLGVCLGPKDSALMNGISVL